MRFFFLLLFLSVSSISFAQSSSRKHHKNVFGLQGGFNIANMRAKSGGQSSSGKAVGRGSAGIFIDLEADKLLSAQLGLAYSGAGMRDDNDMFVSLSYLSLPLLIKVNIHSANISFFAGPQLSYLMAAKAKTLGTPNTNIRKSCQDFETSLLAGLQVRPGGGNVVLSGGYQLGMSNVFSTVPQGTTVKNRVFQFSLGYRFAKK